MVSNIKKKKEEFLESLSLVTSKGRSISSRDFGKDGLGNEAICL